MGDIWPYQIEQHFADPVVLEDVLDGCEELLSQTSGRNYTPDQPHVTYEASGPDNPLLDRKSWGAIGVRLGHKLGTTTAGFNLLGERYLIDRAPGEAQSRWFGIKHAYPGNLNLEFKETGGIVPAHNARNLDYLDLRSLAEAIHPVIEDLRQFADTEEPDVDQLQSEYEIVKEYFGRKTNIGHVRVYVDITDELIPEDNK